MGNNVSTFRQEFGLILVGAIIFTASFLWKDLLMDVQDKFFPKTAGLCGRVFFTLLATVILVIIAISLKKTLRLKGDGQYDIGFDESAAEKNGHANNGSTHDPGINDMIDSDQDKNHVVVGEHGSYDNGHGLYDSGHDSMW